MKGPTHLAAGLLAGVLVHQAFQPEVHWVIGMAAAGAAALVPDWIQINVPGANQVARGVFGHRGMSHWLLTAIVVWAALKLAGVELAVSILAGWISHIALDLVSGGTSAMWPWPGRITLAHIKTGGKLDVLVGASCLVLMCVILVGRIL